MVEPIASVGTQEQMLLEQLSGKKCPVVLAINKIDTVEKDALLEVIAAYSQAFTFAAIIPISAKTGDGVDALIVETGHRKILDVYEYAKDKNIGMVYFSHNGREIINDIDGSIKKVNELFKGKALICNDKMTVKL